MSILGDNCNRARSRSAASSVQREDVRITEMINGVLVSKPAKKYQEITPKNEPKGTTSNYQSTVTTTSEPQVIDLQEHARSGSKAGSIFVQENKMKVIHDFVRSNGRF